MSPIQVELDRGNFYQPLLRLEQWWLVFSGDMKGDQPVADRVLCECSAHGKCVTHDAGW